MTDLYDDIPHPTDDDAPPPDNDYAGIPVDEDTGEIHDDPDDPMVQLYGMLTALQADQEQQQQRLTDIEDMLKAVPDGPWNWANLTGPERRKLWERLYQWVNWLEDRYLRHLFPTRGAIPEWPADWYRHPVAVEILTALMVAHAAAYRKKASPPSFALVEWHERCLWPTLARIDALKLWSRDDTTRDWNGPTPHPTRRNDTRFTQWMMSDVTPASTAPSTPPLPPLPSAEPV